MRFSASSADLLKALNTVAGAVPTKSTMAILENILLEREEDRLRLSATDLEISIIQRLTVQFETNGSTAATSRVAVPAKRLLETIRALPDIPVHFSSDSDFQIELRTDQGHYKMVGMDGRDFPAHPVLADANQIESTGQVLRRAIQKTSFAVSRDALRPAMMGVYFQIGPEQTRVVATDGHRLVRLTLDDVAGEEALNFIVPERALSLAGRVATDGSCLFSVGGGYAGFEFGDTNLLARLIEEPYPNYEAVIPSDNDRRLLVNRNSMLAAVKRVGLYSSSMTHQLRLSLTQKEVIVSAEDIERASAARETVLCEYAGDEMEIGFNAVYLTEVLQNVDSEEVVFAFGSPNKAGVVTPAEQHESEDMMMLIMPVMLNTYA